MYCDYGDINNCVMFYVLLKSLYGVVDNNIIEQLRQKCSLELQKLHNTGLQSIAGN